MSVEYGYCHCGCGQKTKLAKETKARDGAKKGEPNKYLFGHGRRITNPPYVTEDRGYKTPCWIWQRCTHPNGYGRTYRSGKVVYAHGAFYEEKYGAVPAGLELDHLCNVRNCCNPDHLEAVTHQVNLQRARMRKRGVA